MPNTQSLGPNSTPQLYLEDHYNRLVEQVNTQQQNLAAQQPDQMTYDRELQKIQRDFDTQRADIMAKLETMRQTQSMADLQFITPDDAQEAMWGQVLPPEVHKKMFPKQEVDMSGAPYSPEQMGKYGGTIESFLKTAGEKRTGIGGWDWTKKDAPPTLSTMLDRYKTWQQSIGYSGMSPSRQGQVDSEWDAWVTKKGWDKVWSPKLEGVKALRAKGPTTRSYSKMAKGTPTGPREATNPLQDSIAASLPKKREPKPVAATKRVYAKNPQTGERVFSDDGGGTWQKAE